MELPAKKYEIIYADPPWSFKAFSSKGNGRSAENHYSTMSIEDIANLPIQNIAAENAVLFMWVTYPTMERAFEVIKAWGFEYKTCAFTWVKRNKKTPSWFWGLGYWTRSNAEICLLATKGNPKRVNAGVHSVLDDPVSRHSEKPNSARERIVSLMGDRSRIELFARQPTDGWDVWGNDPSLGD